MITFSFHKILSLRNLFIFFFYPIQVLTYSFISAVNAKQKVAQTKISLTLVKSFFDHHITSFMVTISKAYFLIAIVSMVVLSCKKDVTPFVSPEIPINERADTAPHILSPMSVRINNVIHGLYSAVPANYNNTTKTYPLLIFIVGAGQLGSTPAELKYLLQDGMGKLLYEKAFPRNFVVGNKISHTLFLFRNSVHIQQTSR
jgi:hypothetical protein